MNIWGRKSMKQRKANKNRSQFKISGVRNKFLLLLLLVIDGSCFDRSQNSGPAVGTDPGIELVSCKEECSEADVLPFFDNEDLEKRLIRAREVSGILEQLGNSRENFLKTGDFADLFPTIYYYTTKFEFEKVLANKTRHPTEKMEMIVGFYDAYKFNRDLYEKSGTDAVESHWKKYYEKAQAANKTKEFKDKYETMTEILFDGIDAHLVYDLPRFVRHFSLSSQRSLSEIKAEYDAFDDVFSAAAAQTNRDILTTLKMDEGDEKTNKLFLAGASYLKTSRKISWDLGVSSKPLLTKDPQPVVTHNADSTKFLPKDIADKGICRKVQDSRVCPLSGYRWLKYGAGK